MYKIIVGLFQPSGFIKSVLAYVRLGLNFLVGSKCALKMYNNENA